MLKSILMATLLTANLQQSEQAYREHLDYSTVASGALSSELARQWGLPQHTGMPFALMRPASGRPILLRFVEHRSARGYRAMRREGWNVVEILVEDPDQLAQRLAGTPFTVVGQPAYLTEKKNIRAIQVEGPAGELLYLTRVIDPSRSRFRISSAQSPIDHIFIVVLGGRDMDALRDFYQDTLGSEVLGPVPYRIGVLSEIWGKPLDTLYPLGIVQLVEPFLIELDGYPSAVLPLKRRAELPPGGVLMVSFMVERIAPDWPLLRSPRPISAFPYLGRCVAAMRGSVGEWIEVVENTPRRGGDCGGP